MLPQDRMRNILEIRKKNRNGAWEPIWWQLTKELLSHHSNITFHQRLLRIKANLLVPNWKAVWKRHLLLQDLAHMFKKKLGMIIYHIQWEQSLSIIRFWMCQGQELISHLWSIKLLFNAENLDLVKEERLSLKMLELYLDLESILQNSETLKNNLQDSVSAQRKELLQLMKN